MDNLQNIKRKFTIVLGVLGVLDLVLLGYFLWPGSSVSALEAHKSSLQHQLDIQKKEVAPLIGMEEKLKKTRNDISVFYQQKIPTRSSDISQQLDKLRQDNGVDIQAIRFSVEKAEKNDLPGVQRISIDTTVTGDYAKVAKYINAMEKANLLFIITQVQLSGREGGMVSLQIKFDTFLRETT